MKKEYIFTSERLGFREWSYDDLDAFSELNADPVVMEHFPNTLTKEATKDFIKRLINHQKDNGYCYYATEFVATGEFIGFIGLAYQTYESDFSPGVDIGWRLKKSAWGKGYATEGAKRCLEYAFDDLTLNKVFSTCVLQNVNSENVMKKIGMTKMSVFKHPLLNDYPEYENCVLYEIKKPV